MCVRHPSYGVLRHDHWPRRDQNGQEEAGSHREMETPHLSQRNPVVHWICKLLQEIHSWFLQHCRPPQPTHSQRGTLDLDPTPTTSLWTPQTHLLLCPCPTNPWCNLSILHHDRCLLVGCWSSTHADRWELWPAPMHILLLHFLLCPMQLWHLWLWTPCSDLSIGGMVPISPGNCTPHHHHHWPYEPLLYQRPLKTVQMAGQMVTVSTGLWHTVADHPWDQNGPSRCIVQIRSCGHHPRQPGNVHMSRTCCHPSTRSYPSPENSVLHQI